MECSTTVIILLYIAASAGEASTVALATSTDEASTIAVVNTCKSAVLTKAELTVVFLL